MLTKPEEFFIYLNNVIFKDLNLPQTIGMDFKYNPLDIFQF